MHSSRSYRSKHTSPDNMTMDASRPCVYSLFRLINRLEKTFFYGSVDESNKHQAKSWRIGYYLICSPRLTPREVMLYKPAHSWRTQTDIRKVEGGGVDRYYTTFPRGPRVIFASCSCNIVYFIAVPFLVPTTNSWKQLQHGRRGVLRELQVVGRLPYTAVSFSLSSAHIVVHTPRYYNVTN